MKQCDMIMEFLGGRYLESDYPVLGRQYSDWLAMRPFAGLRVLDSTPIFRNTLLKHRNLLVGGAELVLGKGAFISSDSVVVDFARNGLGLRILESWESMGEGVDVVMDCAGSFIDVASRLGYVELTGSGVEKYRGSGKLCYLADSSRVKLQETVLGTGDSFFRAMVELGYSGCGEGSRLVVFGGGKVGRGLVRGGLERGFEVVVVGDKSAEGGCGGGSVEGVEVVDFRERRVVEELVRGAYCIVMATGVVGALERTIDVGILGECDVLVANMGAEDEVGDSVPDDRVLGGKRTLNFILEEPTDLRFIEATMALHNYGGEWLVRNAGKKNTGGGVVLPDAELEEFILSGSCVRL